MPRPPDHSIHLFLFALILLANSSFLVNAQQKRPDHLSHLTLPSHGKSTHYENPNHSVDTSDVRAIATTLAPVSEKAVGAPPAGRSSRSTGGLTTRLSARSLQDWDVEDVVLLATVDGKIYARDRRTGAHRWELEADRPIVETIYHPRNKSIDGSTPVTDEFLWIVEPSQEGALYGYNPGNAMGVQPLGMTIKQLHELTPFVNEEHPPVRYLVDRKTQLYTIDISTGNVVKVFNTEGVTLVDDSSCRRVSGFESFEDDECRVTGTLHLGRTEYTVQVSSAITSELICTIKYFEWEPNRRDRDLIKQYASTKDNRYVFSRFDGRAWASQLLQGDDRGLPTKNTPIYHQKFPSPIAQVFDVVRPNKDQPVDTSLVILPQPSGPMSTGNIQSEPHDRVFINCTENGSWYALSEHRYPLVTFGASQALCLKEEYRVKMPEFREKSEAAFKLALTGVHDLGIGSHMSADPTLPLIAGPKDYSLPDLKDIRGEVGVVHSQSSMPGLGSLFPASTVLVLVAVLTILFYPRFKTWHSQAIPVTTPQAALDESNTSMLHQEAMTIDAVSSLESSAPDQELSKSSEDFPEIRLERTNSDQDEKENKTPEQAPEVPKIEIVEPAQPNTTRKKKAHRGNRGGRAQREKEKAKIVAQTQQSPTESVIELSKTSSKEISIQPDVISKHAPIADPQNGLRNLNVRFDRILGSGSGGTFVFEGTFEERDVAVKRMLRQQYELASQEVSLLEQNDEHQNVIRYFCRREDDNFLYIALELCQASLWDLFRDGRGNDSVEDKHLTLRDELLQDPRRVLKQLAEGLSYLHSFRIVHRDIKPQNMLIAYPKKNNLKAFPRLVISDFGLCKTLPENVSTLIGTTGNAGTAGWMAPELISQPKDAGSNGSQPSGPQSEPASNRSDATVNGNANGKVKRAIDIFSLGCVFFYVLTNGQHPFDDEEGWMALRERNIKTGRAKNMKALELLGADTVDLVQWMLQHDPEDRPTAAQVLAHPFFWDAEDRLEFLSAASDRFDQEPRDGTSPSLKELELSAGDVIPKVLPGASHSQSATHSHLRLNSTNEMATTMSLPIPEPNFLSALDRRFVDTLGRQRKYDPGKLTDLLRALRNKHHHWDDMPDDVKSRVGEVPEGYLHFWESRFPGLVVKVWRTVIRLGISSERRFGRWFANKGNPLN